MRLIKYPSFCLFEVRSGPTRIHDHNQLVRRRADQGRALQAVPALRQALPGRPESAGQGRGVRPGEDGGGELRRVPSPVRERGHESRRQDNRGPLFRAGGQDELERVHAAIRLRCVLLVSQA